MKFAEYIVLCSKLFRENNERMGQTYFNVLNRIRPDIAKEIRGSDCDAFYDNNKLPAMLAVVYSSWNT